MTMIDIEDLNRKLDKVLSTEFYYPNEEDLKKYKPLIQEIVQMPNIKQTHISKLLRSYKSLHKNSFLMQVFYELSEKGEMDAKFEPILQKALAIKKVRSWSGVLVVTIFTSPYPEYVDDESGIIKKQEFSCAFNCAYCPNEPGQPRSYLKGEPGVLRANRHKFDCVEQMWARMNSLAVTGHKVDKLEVIVLGGTWTSYPLPYREQFCRDIYYAANTFRDPPNTRRLRLSLQEEKQLNWDAQVRVIGLTLETRPDQISKEELIRFRHYGCTRVQLGVQHVDDNILKKINRKCATSDTIRSIKMLKDAAFKVDIHIMPNLPGATPNLDKDMLMNLSLIHI